MWAFKDKGDRDVCLIPEATALCQELWRDRWSKTSRSCKLFYASRCYRYERPQAGRYREFTQFGVELLGEGDTGEAIELLQRCLNEVGADYRLDTAVRRGLAYYTEEGFEAVCDALGAQKQIAGGGRYAEGVGFAIGIDRLLLSLPA
jgi:histidyl-tRNA synthetase